MHLRSLSPLLFVALIAPLCAEPVILYPSSDVRMTIISPQPKIIGSDDTTIDLNVGDTKDNTEWSSVILFDLTGRTKEINAAKSIMLQITVYRTLGRPLTDAEIVTIEPIDAGRIFPSDGSSPSLAVIGRIPADAQKGDRYEFDVSKAVQLSTFDRRVGFRVQLVGGQITPNATADCLILVAGSKPLNAESGLTDADRPQLVITP